MRYTVRLRLKETVVEDGVVVLDMESQKVHQLNTAASFVWDKTKQGFTQEETIREFLKYFQVSQETAVTDVLETLHNLSELGLLLPSNTSSSDLTVPDPLATKSPRDHE